MPDSSTMRQIHNKLGDSIKGRRPTQAEMIQAAEKLSKMGRGTVTRDWGDQKNDKRK